MIASKHVSSSQKEPGWSAIKQVVLVWGGADRRYWWRDDTIGGHSSHRPSLSGRCSARQPLRISRQREDRGDGFSRPRVQDTTRKVGLVVETGRSLEASAI